MPRELRVGAACAARPRAVNPTCHLAFYGLYATLNADHLLTHGADSVLGGEAEDALVDLAEQLGRARDEVGGRGQAPGEWGSERRGPPPPPPPPPPTPRPPFRRPTPPPPLHHNPPPAKRRRLQVARAPGTRPGRTHT